MLLRDFPFTATDWSSIEPTTHPGDTGVASWRTLTLGALRVRMVEYSAGYLADHWCSKGHVVFCVEGVLDTELSDGRRFTLTVGMSYQVADEAEAHRSSTRDGCRIFIVD